MLKIELRKATSLHAFNLDATFNYRFFQVVAKLDATIILNLLLYMVVATKKIPYTFRPNIIY